VTGFVTGQEIAAAGTGIPAPGTPFVWQSNQIPTVELQARLGLKSQNKKLTTAKTATANTAVPA
jgi:hypothetical protein